MPSGKQPHVSDKTSAKQPPPTSAARTTPSRTAANHPATILRRTSAAPRSMTRHDVLQLQRTVGNGAVRRLLASGRGSSGVAVQTKLALGGAGDEYEQEADRVARQVVERLDAAAPEAATPDVQQAVPEGARGVASAPGAPWPGGGDRLMPKPDIRRLDTEGGAMPDAATEASIERARGGGSPLEGRVGAAMAGAFGVDFGGVKVHTDARAQQLNRSLQAKAFTVGRDIFFGPGAYAPASHEGLELIAHELTHVVQQGGTTSPVAGHATVQSAQTPRRAAGFGSAMPRLIQRVQEKETDYRSSHEIKEMTLEQFDAYAQRQADWFAGPDVQESERDGLRAALGLAREPGMLASSGGFTVEEVLKLDEAQLGHLREYNRLFDQRDPFPMTRAFAAFTAARRGEDLPKLIQVFTRPVLAQALNESALDLVTRGQETFSVQPSWTNDLITYYETVSNKPYFQASEGKDFLSFVEMRRKDKKRPESYEQTALKGRVRNFHRFRADGLDVLRDNFADLSRKRPLTLILHSAIDHNGAFHRSEGLRDVIVNKNILTLMLEGGARLEDYGRQIPELAQNYGIGGKIDQILISGHGGMRSVEMAGTQDTSEPIDLDENLEETQKLYDVIFAHLDPGTQKVLQQSEEVGNLHLRIVYNACLTNTNYVPFGKIPEEGEVGEIANAVREYIEDHPTLKVSTERMLQERGLGQWSAQGANAVTRATDFLNKETGRLELSSTTDKYVVASKLEYVEHGIEPVGVFRAALECLTSTEQGVAEGCIQHMQTRAQSESTDWREIFIAAGFTLVLENDPKQHAFLLSFLSNQDSNIEALLRKSTARVSRLRQIAMLSERAIPFFAAYRKSPTWNLPYFRLVVLQVWMKIKNNEELSEEFLASLAEHDCAYLSPLVDFETLAPFIEGLLGGEPGPGKLRLALLGVLNEEVVAAAKDYLLTLLGGNARFPQGLKLSEVLGGLSTPDTIQARIGKPAPPLEQEVGEKEGNVKLEGDQTNKEWVRSITRRGKVSNVAGAALHAKPDLNSAVFSQLPYDSPLHLFGETQDWFAAEHFTPEEKTRTGYLMGYDLKAGGAQVQDTTRDDEVELYGSLEALAEFEGALMLPSETEVTVEETDLGESQDVVKVSIRRTENRYMSAFVRKADVTAQ